MDLLVNVGDGFSRLHPAEGRTALFLSILPCRSCSDRPRFAGEKSDVAKFFTGRGEFSETSKLDLYGESQWLPLTKGPA